MSECDNQAVAMSSRGRVEVHALQCFMGIVNWVGGKSRTWREHASGEEEMNSMDLDMDLGEKVISISMDLGEKVENVVRSLYSVSSGERLSHQ